MKKIYTLVIILFSVISFSQEKWDKSSCATCADNPFIFEKSVITVMEKYAKSSNDGSVDSPEKKKKFIGAFILENETDKISEGKYILLSSIPSTEKFIMISDIRERHEDEIDENQGIYKNDKSNILIQSLSSNKFYIINKESFNYLDYKQTDENGYKGLIKRVPKSLSKSETEILARYKFLIKSSYQNIKILQGIQKRCLTRGKFDEFKITAADKKIYNNNLSELKIKAAKLLDIDRYDDKNNKLQDLLTTSEIALLYNINDWNVNYYKVN